MTTPTPTTTSTDSPTSSALTSSAETASAANPSAAAHVGRTVVVVVALVALAVEAVFIIVAGWGIVPPTDADDDALNPSRQPLPVFDGDSLVPPHRGVVGADPPASGRNNSGSVSVPDSGADEPGAWADRWPLSVGIEARHYDAVARVLTLDFRLSCQSGFALRTASIDVALPTDWVAQARLLPAVAPSLVTEWAATPTGGQISLRSRPVRHVDPRGWIVATVEIELTPQAVGDFLVAAQLTTEPATYPTSGDSVRVELATLPAPPPPTDESNDGTGTNGPSGG